MKLSKHPVSSNHKPIPCPVQHSVKLEADRYAQRPGNWSTLAYLLYLLPVFGVQIGAEIVSAKFVNMRLNAILIRSEGP